MDREFLLGDWRVEPQRNQIAHGEERVRLDPRVMGVLVCLAERAGEMVSHEQILEKVWEGVFVTDGALTNAIWELRKALGDDPANPRFIQTLPKKGYRLVAAVSPVAREEMVRDIDGRIEIEQAERELAAPPSPTLPLLSAFLALVVLVSGLGIWNLVRPGEESRHEVSWLTVNVPPEQALTSLQIDPSVAISPEGRHLVYVGGSGRERKLYLRPIDRLDSSPIAGTEGALTAFFSPDGKWLGFYTSGKVKKVDLSSGLPIALCDASDPGGASWGPGERILFNSGENSGLSQVSASGGAPSVVTRPDPKQGEVGHFWPEVLPDGRTVLFTIATAKGGQHIGLLSLETGKYRVLLEECSFARYLPMGHIVCMRGRTLVATPFDLERLELKGIPVPVLEGVWINRQYGSAHFALSQEGTLVYVPDASEGNALVWLDRKGASRPLSEIRRPYGWPRLSPDGRSLALVIQEGGEHIWIYDIARAAFMQLTFGPGESAPVWTPDGRRLVFNQGDPLNLFSLPADGSVPEERLTKSDGNQFPNSWTPDGKVLLFTQEPASSMEQADIWFSNLASGRTAQPFLRTPFSKRVGMISPDGRFLAYIADESGRMEVYVRSFPGPGGKWQISNEGGFQPLWARSGRELFYRNGDKMMAVSIETEPVFQAGKPTLLFEGNFSGSGIWVAQYDVAPDGREFLMIQEEPKTQIHVVQNWFEELKERVPADK